MKNYIKFAIYDFSEESWQFSVYYPAVDFERYFLINDSKNLLTKLADLEFVLSKLL